MDDDDDDDDDERDAKFHVRLVAADSRKTSPAKIVTCKRTQMMVMMMTVMTMMRMMLMMTMILCPKIFIIGIISMFGKTFIFQSCLIGICGSRYLGHRTAEEKVNIRISSQPFAEQSVENRNQDFI